MAHEDGKGKFERGLRAFRSGEYESAVEYLSEAVEYDENNDKAWNALGTACAKVKRYSDADLCYENALTIAPDNQTYQKNRSTNAKYLKNSPVPAKGLTDSFFDRIPMDKIPTDNPYLLIGIGLLAIIAISIILLVVLPLFTAPPVPPGPPFSLTVNQTGNMIILTNGGGREIESVSSFTWKVNDHPIGTGKPDDPGTLAIQPGSTASVTLSDLTGTNLSSGIRVLVIANYKEKGAEIALSTTLPPPSPDLLVTTSATPVATPAPVEVARFSRGEVVLDENTGAWWLVTIPPANGTYTLTRTARTPNGTFIPIDETVTNISTKTFELTGKSIGARGPGDTPAGLASMNMPPVMDVPPMHPDPLYQTGDLVRPGSSGDTGMLVILGYDQETDQYKADNLFRYYNGQWGYRTNLTPKWFIRPILEQQYPHRADRITTSDIGIGEDSAPPRTPVKYKPGDIISPDRAGIDHISIITGYSPADDTYQVDTVRNAYDGGWIMPGTPHAEKRAFIERDYPYLIKQVDLSLVKTG